MGLLFSALISSFFTASIAFCQVVEEGTNGHWVDTPEGPDVMEKTVDHQLWVPNPVSQRVSDKDVVLMAPLLRTQKSSASFLHKRAKRKRKTSYQKWRRELSSRKKPFRSSLQPTPEQAQLIHFLKDWGNSCPGDKTEKRVAENRVQVVPFKNIGQLFQNKKLDIFVFQYEKSPKVFKERPWQNFAKNVPVDKGCFVIPPRPKRGEIQKSRNYSLALENFFKRKKHHCQVIHWVEGKGTKEIVQGLCDRDYRSSQEGHI